MAFLLGAIVAMAVVSRIVLLVLLPWKGGGVPKLVVAHVFAVVIAITLYEAGTAGDGGSGGGPALYILGGAVWFFYDLRRVAEVKKAKGGEDAPT